MIKVKITKNVTVSIWADYNGKKQKHLVDYVINEKIEATEIVTQNNPKIIKLKLPDEDIMIIPIYACEIISDS